MKRSWRWSIPILLVAFIAAILVFPRRIFLASKVGLRPAFGAEPIALEVDTNVAHAQVKITVTNTTRSSRPVTFSQLDWHDAPMREPLPDLVLGPWESRSWVFHPIDRRVVWYGNRISYMVHSQTFMQSQTRTFAPQPYVDGNTLKLLQWTYVKIPPTSSSLANVFRIQPMPPELSASVRISSVSVDGKALNIDQTEKQIAEGLTVATLPTTYRRNHGVVRLRYRLTPWSKWVHAKHVF